MKEQTCQRCGSKLKRRRVTCFLCGRRIGRFYDCGCGEQWSDSGPSRFVCYEWALRQPSDCKEEEALIRRRYDEGELRSSFVRQMVRLNGRWP